AAFAAAGHPIHLWRATWPADPQWQALLAAYQGHGGFEGEEGPVLDDMARHHRAWYFYEAFNANRFPLLEALDAGRGLPAGGDGQQSLAQLGGALAHVEVGGRLRALADLIQD